MFLPTYDGLCCELDHVAEATAAPAMSVFSLTASQHKRARRWSCPLPGGAHHVRAAVQVPGSSEAPMRGPLRTRAHNLLGGSRSTGDGARNAAVASSLQPL